MATDRTPASLDLPAALQARGPGSTIASPGVWALDRALDPFESPACRAARYGAAAELGRRLRRGLEALGLAPIAEEPWAAPVVTSFALPPGWRGADFRDACGELGFEVATDSHYLRARGWAQVATMGAVTDEHAAAFLAGLGRRLRDPTRSG